MTELETLRRARSVFKSRRHIRRSFFGNGIGTEEACKNPTIPCCAFGAVKIALFEAYEFWTNHEELSIKLNESAMKIHRMSLVDVNDKLGKKAALKVFDHAIEQLEKGL